MICGHKKFVDGCGICTRCDPFSDAYDPKFARFAAKVAGPGQARNTNERRSLPCTYLGGVTGEAVSCETCQGSVRIKLQSCEVHGECTTKTHVTKDGKPVKCCKTCKQYVVLQKDQSEPVRKTGPKNLLFVSNYLELDGAPTILANIVPHLRGFTKKVFSYSDGPLRKRFEAAGIPVTTEFSLDGIDLVVANTIVSAPAIAAARESGIPAVWMIHESDPAMCGNLESVRDLIGYPETVIFPSYATRDVYAATMPPHRSQVIHSIIPPVPIVPKREHRDFVVLTFGRDEHRKGQGHIRQALTLLDESFRLRAVHDDPDPHRHFAEADVYVCSSYVEAFPLSIQEAKAHGVPVITTPVFGCSEIIRDGIDGVHFEQSDVIKLRDLLQRMRDDHVWRESLSRPLSHLPTFGESVADYERAITHSAGGIPTAPTVHVIWHVACIGQWWESIAEEQIRQFAEAGLYRIHVTHLGDKQSLDKLFSIAAKRRVQLDVSTSSPQLDEYERPALRLAWMLARGGDTPIIYVHGKGVTHDPQAEALFHDWRRLMMRELIGDWRRRLKDLEEFDVAGVNWWEKKVESPHFSGNFWAARADWIRRLPAIDTVYRDRYSCELWIGKSKVRAKARSLICTDVRFWDQADGTATLYNALKPLPASV